MIKTIEEINFIKKQDTNIMDGPEFHLSCAVCGKTLVMVKVIQPDAPLKSNIQINCPCGGKSATREIDGQFRYDTVGNIKLLNVVTNNNSIEVFTK